MIAQTTSHTTLPVLIAGGGPTGLTLACVLARRGVACRIIDKAAEAPRGSRGKGLQPRTLEVFDDLGVIDEILATGSRYPKLRLHVWRFFLSLTMFKRREPTADVPYPNTWMVPQFRTEEILRERLAGYGVEVEYGSELVAFAQDNRGVTAEISRPGGGETLRAAYLVGADGGRSVVRKHLGVGFAGETIAQDRMIVGDVEVDGLSRDYWHVWPKSKKRTVALCPLPNTNLFQLTAQIPESAGEPDLTERGIQELVRASLGPKQQFRIHSPRWLSVYRPNVRMVDRYRIGRIFLAGDAAHVHPPAGGQGLNTGVQDAYNLGWKLAESLAGSPESLLDTYEKERLPIAASVLGLSMKLYRKASDRQRGAQKRGEETQQLGLNYRDSGLSRTIGRAAAAVQAGDRAPDAACLGGFGQHVRLFDLFRGPHFTLLAFGAGHGGLVAALNRRDPALLRAYEVLPSGAAATSGVIDTAGHAARAYAAGAATLVLIRPDGYIGLISDHGSIEAIGAYLAQVLGERAIEPNQLLVEA